MVNLLVILKTGRLFTSTNFFGKKYSNLYKLHKIISFLDFTTWYHSLVCHDVYMDIRPPGSVVRNPPATQEVRV